MKKIKYLTGAVLMGSGVSLAWVSEQTHASPEMQGDFQPHVYLGAGYGGYKARGGEFDDERDVIGVHAGIRFTPYFGLEGEYTDFGEYGDSLASAEVDGYGAALVGRLPLTDTLALYAKAGQFFWDADFEVGPLSDSLDGDEPYYGVGLDFNIAEPVALTLEYSRYDVELSDSEVPEELGVSDTDLDTVKLSARFQF